jgi:hypothetical protein
VGDHDRLAVIVENGREQEFLLRKQNLVSVHDSIRPRCRAFWRAG